MSHQDTKAFVAEQYRLHAARVFRRCLAMSGGNVAWAEDMTQEVFLRLAERHRQLHDQGPLLGWLLTVAYRLCVDRLRHERSLWRRATALFASEPVTPSPSVTDEPDPEALAVAFQQALTTLAPRARGIVAMRYLDGMSQRAIAQSLGLSEGYVSKILQRSLATLRGLGWEAFDA